MDKGLLIVNTGDGKGKTETQFVEIFHGDSG